MKEKMVYFVSGLATIIVVVSALYFFHMQRGKNAQQALDETVPGESNASVQGVAGDSKNGSINRKYIDDIRQLLREEKYDESIALIGSHLKVNGGNAELLGLLGDAYLMKNENEKAVDFYNKAIAISSDHPWFFRALGMAYWQLGKIEEAEQSFEKAISSDNTQEKREKAESYMGLSRIESSRGNKDNSIKYIKKALEIQPDNSQFQAALEASKNN